MRRRTKEILSSKEDIIGKEVEVAGWVKSVRSKKEFSFLEINDGSSLSNLQIFVDRDISPCEDIKVGSSLIASGKIVKSPGKNQKYELQAKKVHLLGKSDPESYPLQKKRHSFEFLRTIAHLRPRTNTQGAVARIRNALSFATHKFFNDRGFLYVHTPIITALDCEGGGEMFRVSSDTKDGEFFLRPTFLTVSGQLNGEIFACSLGDIYTFGPTFRAENSNTSRHLSEFWMVEPEMAFTDLRGDIEVAESYLKYMIDYVLKNCEEDLIFFDRFIEKGLIDKLKAVSKTPFEIITYDQAIDILESSTKKFEFPVKWGIDLQAEHERYLTETHFKKPVVVTNFPSKIKAFYMRQNDDKKTVAAMDILLPKIGEIIGGSQREERLDILQEKILNMNLNENDYRWYLDLRRYGTVPHSGFGLGFDRMVQYVTGMDNIRDIIPFPRYPGHADF